MSQGIETGLVAAMLMEIKPLISSWQRENVVVDGRNFTFYLRGNVVATCSGPTAVNARAATKVLVERYAPRMVLSVGFAGALVANARVGDIIVPGQVVNAATSRVYSSTTGTGRLVTCDKVAGAAEKMELAARLGAVAVDMEAAAVAEVAQARGIGFAAVKAISDELGAEMNFVAPFVRPSGFRTAAFLAHVAVRPALWRVVGQLRINSERAASNLSSTLANILSSSEGTRGALAQFAREHAHAGA